MILRVVDRRGKAGYFDLSVTRLCEVHHSPLFRISLFRHGKDIHTCPADVFCSRQPASSESGVKLTSLDK
jgi:hypothetical protein